MTPILPNKRKGGACCGRFLLLAMFSMAPMAGFTEAAALTGSNLDFWRLFPLVSKKAL